METKKCKYCKEEINKNAKVCPKCGKKQSKHLLLIIIIIIFACIIFASLGNDDTSTTSENETTETTDETTTNEVDKSAVIYDDGTYKITFTDYEYKSVSDRIVIKVTLENNSSEDINFSFDGSVAIDGATVSGGYLYETVKSNTKTNVELSLYDLNENGIDGTTCNQMRFNADIYKSENYIITERIIDNQEFTYTFAR